MTTAKEEKEISNEQSLCIIDNTTFRVQKEKNRHIWKGENQEIQSDRNIDERIRLLNHSSQKSSCIPSLPPKQTTYMTLPLLISFVIEIIVSIIKCQSSFFVFDTNSWYYQNLLWFDYLLVARYTYFFPILFK